MSTISQGNAHGSIGAARVAVILFAALQIMTPVLPSLGVGEPIGSQSDSVRTLVTPAGWAFAIWGPLYTGSILFAVYQMLPAQKSNDLLAGLRWPAAGAFLGNAVWAAYTQMQGLSFISAVIIIWTLACLLVAYRRLTDHPSRFTAGERWFAVLPLSALTAWLTVATLVNITAALRFHGVDAGEGTPLLAAAIVVIGGGIAGTALLRSRGNPVYALVLLWALSAIYAAGGSRAGEVAAAALIAAALVIVGCLIGLRQNGRERWLA